MDDHIAFAFDLNGRRLDAESDIVDALAVDDPAWLHLAADHPDTPEWVATHLHWLDPAIRSALTDAQTRPRALQIGHGVLLNLRGINFNEGADPEDMVSLRLYADPGRIVSLSRRRLKSVDALAERVAAGEGPDRAGALVATLLEELTERIETQVSDLERRSDELETAVITAPRGEHGTEATDLRLESNDLKRFLPAQRDAAGNLGKIEADWLTEVDRRLIGEQHDQLTRTVETIDAVGEQLTTIAGEIDAAREERLNRNLYVLSVISAVFLPLGFLTGLMGINVAGMPGVDWQPAFWVFVAMLVGVTGAVLGTLKWMRIL